VYLHTENSSIYDLSETERELEKWWRDLNLIVGPLALTMAIGCKSLSFWPGLGFSFLGSLVLLSISLGIQPRYTSRITELRKLARSDSRAAEALSFAEKNFLGHWRYLSFIVGCMSLGMTAAWYMFGGIYAASIDIPHPITAYLPTLP